jgi:hypothetical protein
VAITLNGLLAASGAWLLRGGFRRMRAG